MLPKQRCGVPNLKIYQNFVWTILLDLWEKNLYGGVKIIWGSDITTISLFQFFWNTNILKFIKEVLKENFTFVLFELLPTGLFKYVWPFVTTQHEWAWMG